MTQRISLLALVCAALLTLTSGGMLQAAAPAQTERLVAPAPTNPAAANALARITVSAPGIQRITGVALAAAGVNIAALDPSRLQVIVQGSEVALEMSDGGDGQLNSGDELRFFASAPGDRWSRTSTYWLMQGAGAGLRMQSRSALPAGAPAGVALQRLRWREGHIYDTTMAGPVGDYWFAVDLRIDPSAFETEVTASIPLTATMPLIAGAVTLTVEGAAYTTTSRTLTARMGAASQSQSWSGVGAWTQSFALGQNSATATLALQRGATPAGIEIQAAEVLRPVQLSMGGNGALFEGQSGTFSYAVSGAASARALYDVTAPGQPVRLTIPAGTSFTFQDGSARRYVLTGPGTLLDPLVALHTPVDLATPLNASALYIAPTLFHAALQPLIARRASQGYVVRVVDVQAIYDSWSGGQVDPRAIRAFLRYARETWSTAPVGVTLVGDATADPLNYVGRNNTNFIPPYLAEVDPFIRETACENCFVQLDGEDPLLDPLPDIGIGRLPVKSVAELESLVTKILTYETAPSGGWTSRAVVATDNGYGSDGVPDPAGNFASLGDQSIANLPPQMQVRRVYFDPSPQRPPESWREPDGPRARDQLISAISEGAALVTYFGHSSQFQWAVTNLDSQPSYLLGLFDADLLRNYGRAAIFRNMTCLTASFHTPAFSGTSLDERLLLQPGGGVAVWGSTGKGVVNGQEALLRGFDQALTAAHGTRPTLGSLILAGYTELYTNGTCCHDAIQTFALLGDPLTGVRVAEAWDVSLPGVVR